MLVCSKLDSLYNAYVKGLEQNGVSNITHFMLTGSENNLQF